MQLQTVLRYNYDMLFIIFKIKHNWVRTWYLPSLSTHFLRNIYRFHKYLASYAQDERRNACRCCFSSCWEMDRPTQTQHLSHSLYLCGLLH